MLNEKRPFKEIRTFLVENGWRELSVQPATHKGKPGSTFHQFVRDDDATLTVLVEELGDMNGFELWTDLDPATTTPHGLELLKAIREFRHKPSPAQTS